MAKTNQLQINLGRFTGLAMAKASSRSFPRYGVVCISGASDAAASSISSGTSGAGGASAAEGAGGQGSGGQLQRHVEAPERRGDHEDDQQHQHHGDEARDVNARGLN
jgi:hypothetical protein